MLDFGSDGAAREKATIRKASEGQIRTLKSLGLKNDARLRTLKEDLGVRDTYQP